MLLETRAFVGRHGNLDNDPPQRRALLSILSRPDSVAAPALTGVFDRGRLEGKLYALIGLQRLDSAAFKNRAESFLESDEWVLYYNYDMIDCERVGELADRIATGEVGRWIIEGQSSAP